MSNGSMLAAVQTMLNNVLPIMGYEGISFATDRINLDTTRGIWTASFTQTHLGVPVLGSYIGLTFDQVGRLLSFGTNLYNDIQVTNSPFVSREQAINIASIELDFGGKAVQSDATLFLTSVPASDDFTYIWRVTLAGTERKASMIDLNAYSGEVTTATEYALRMHAPEREYPSNQAFQLSTDKPAELERAAFRTGSVTTYTVSGYVKYRHSETPQSSKSLQPMVRTKVSVIDPSGSPYSDQWSNFTTGFYSLPFPGAGSKVVLEAVTPGSYLATSDLAPVISTLTQNANTVVNLQWDATHDLKYASNFLQHTGRMQHYLGWMIGGFMLTGWDSELDYEASYGCTSETFPVFSGPPLIEFGNCSAQSRDAALHEYAHAAIMRLYNGYIDDGDPNSAEESAMDEGMADYFTAAVTGDVYIGDGGLFSNPDHVRTVGPPLNVPANLTLSDWDDLGDWDYPDGLAGHMRGQILSGTLWDLRISTSLKSAWGNPSTYTKDVDELAWASLYFSPRPRTFYDYYLNVHDANAYLHSGDGADEIDAILCARRFDLVGVDCGASKNHEFAASSAYARLDVFPNPASSLMNLVLKSSTENRVVVDIFDIVGRRITRVHSGTLSEGTHEYRLDMKDYTAGVYIVRARIGNTVVNRFVVVAR